MGKNICIADRGFSLDAYRPQSEIVYDKCLNRELFELIQANPVHYAPMLRNGATKKHSNFRYLYDYIMACTEHMPEHDFKLADRIYWVLQEWQDFPVCAYPGCGCRLIVDARDKAFRLTVKNGKLVEKWPRFCCIKHAQAAEETRRAYVSTCRRKYGAENTFQVPEFKEKIIETLVDRYGVEHPAQAPEIMKKMQDTYEERTGYRNPYQNVELMEQVAQDRFERTGYRNAQQNPEIRAKTIADEIKEYGCPHIFVRNKQPGYEKKILNNPYDEPLFTLFEFAATDNSVVPMRFRCRKCGKEFEAIHVRRHNRCPDCYPEDQVKHPASFISALNRRAYAVLDKAGIQYEKEFKIDFADKYSRHSFRAYDLKFGNLLVELNGDYWHANPNVLYNGKTQLTADMVLTFAGNRKVKVGDIWTKDAEKKDLAWKNGFEVVYLWESEMNGMDDDQLLAWFKARIS